MSQLAPDLTGIIVEGLEPNGKLPKKKSVPGIMSFKPSSFSISAGTAILKVDLGAWQLVHIHENLIIENDEPDKSDALRVLVLALKSEHGRDPDGEKCAYDTLTPYVQFQRQGQALEAHQVPIARELATKVWTTDTARLLQPDHPALSTIFAELDELEDVIWNADRHGKFWDTFRLGRVANLPNQGLDSCDSGTDGFEFSAIHLCRPGASPSVDCSGSFNGLLRTPPDTFEIGLASLRLWCL